jgi:branched-subunit amino acid ABC-type transport system permease component
MYSLVALGFVLIYKASGVFNFAQGARVFFAGLARRFPASHCTSRAELRP